MENARESGFINSQPCIAEFMSDIPHIHATFARSSITPDSRLPPYCQPLNSSNSLQPDITSVNGSDATGSHGGAAVKLPEYPWMREKKPSRKAVLPAAESPIGPLGNLYSFY